jgi:hypothetical protein
MAARSSNSINAKKRAEKEATAKKLAVQEAAKVVLARRDLGVFAESILRDKEGSYVKMAPIHQQWFDHLNYCWMIKKASVILAPYNHGKSQLMALALPLWLLGQNPNLIITMVSSAEDIAAKRLQKCRDYIKKSPEYQRIFPWVKLDESKPNNAHSLNVIQEGIGGAMTGSIDYSMAAYGYTSSEGQGSRSDVLIFDDVADQKNSRLSAAMRKGLLEMVQRQWLGRVDKKVPVRRRDRTIISKGGIICVIGTRFHQEDIYNFWMNQQEGYCILEQGISDNLNHLNTRIFGALKQPCHPVLTKYRDWEPAYLETDSRLESSDGASTA